MTSIDHKIYRRISAKVLFPSSYDKAHKQEDIEKKLAEVKSLENGEYDEQALVNMLNEEYGYGEESKRKTRSLTSSTSSAPPATKPATKGRKRSEKIVEEESKESESSEPTAKGKRGPPRKKRMAAGEEPKVLADADKAYVKENEGIAAAIREIGDIYIHVKDVNKGIAYERAAKVIRESHKQIKTKKDARELDGIGERKLIVAYRDRNIILFFILDIADHIEEYLTTGKIHKLGEMREESD
jgi:hypothetical protein